MKYKILITAMFCTVAIFVQAQSINTDTVPAQAKIEADTITAMIIDSAYYISDTLAVSPRKRVADFKPKAMRSVWMGVLFPGLGQIYNRRYWKLPILYGGLAGCAYAISWNGKYYDDYLRAYRDILDADPNTTSYIKALPYGTDPNSTYAVNYLNQRQNFYRKYRDLSIIGAIALYALSIVDAFVDAQLRDFDVSPDLSLQITPKIIETNKNNISSSAIGMQLQFTF